MNTVGGKSPLSMFMESRFRGNDGEPYQLRTLSAGGRYILSPGFTLNAA